MSPIPDTGISIGIYAPVVAARIGSPFVLRSPVAFRSTVRGLSLGCTPVYIISSVGIQAPIFIAMILAVFHSVLHWQVWNHRVTTVLRRVTRRINRGQSTQLPSALRCCGVASNRPTYPRTTPQTGTDGSRRSCLGEGRYEFLVVWKRIRYPDRHRWPD